MESKKANVRQITPEMIVSKSWDDSRLGKFFRSLEKKAIFGYSSAFTLEEIIKLAHHYGVDVEVLPKSNPLRKKYGDFVLRVRQPYVSPENAPIRMFFNDIYCITRKKSPSNRKCKGTGCSNTILKGDEFLEVSKLKELHTGRKAYDIKSLCGDCAESFIKSKIAGLLKVLSRSTGAIDPIIKIIKEL